MRTSRSAPLGPWMKSDTRQSKGPKRLERATAMSSQAGQDMEGHGESGSVRAPGVSAKARTSVSRVGACAKSLLWTMWPTPSAGSRAM